MFLFAYSYEFLLEPFLGILDMDNNLYSSINSPRFSEKWKRLTYENLTP